MPSTNILEASVRNARLSWTERLGYGAGDAGFNFYWAIIGSYLTFFYTDVFGLTAASTATMITTTKIIDAFTDPAMGALADRTESRWGKFRPYLILGLVPMMLAAIVVMTTPSFEPTGKLVWAYSTYGILMVVYTVLNIPYNALSAVLTTNGRERTLLNSTRFFFAYLTSIIVGALTPTIARSLGGGDLFNPTGWQLTMALYATAASLLIGITFFTTHERIRPRRHQTPTAPLDDLRALLNCRPWLILFLVAMSFMITLTVRSSSAAYFFRYYIQRNDLLGAYVGLQYFGLMLGALLSSYAARFIEKVRLLKLSLLIVAALSIALFAFAQPELTTTSISDGSDWSLNLLTIFSFNFAISVALGFKAPITWSMYADIADFNEWRTGKRATGMTFSATTFSQKLGGAAGSALLLYVLAIMGYEAGNVDSNASTSGIVYMQTVIPGLFALITAGLLKFYTLDKETLIHIQADLAKRDVSEL